MSKLHLLVVTLLLFFTGCSFTPTPKNSLAMPSWIMQPSPDGKIGAIGVSARTYDQSISSQRKLAIMRALSELSLQKGVKVKIRIQKEEVVTNARSHYKMKDTSTYKTNNNVTAHIEKVWMDRTSSELYVWMVLDN